jgi:hypothetical protein
MLVTVFSSIVDRFITQLKTLPSLLFVACGIFTFEALRSLDYSLALRGDRHYQTLDRRLCLSAKMTVEESRSRYLTNFYHDRYLWNEKPTYFPIALKFQHNFN